VKKRVAIVGSRPPKDADKPTLAAYAEMIEQVHAFVRSLSLQTVIVSGGAHGVDMHAIEQAKALGMLTVECEVSPMAWQKRGHMVAHVRNQLVVDISDDVYAFWFRKTPGTAITIEMARLAGKLRNVVEYT
jgi:hypothetical protein